MRAILEMDMPESCYSCQLNMPNDVCGAYCMGADNILETDQYINCCHPDCPLHPVEDNDYTALAQLAYDMVMATMQEGEKKHGKDGWKEQSIPCHLYHMAIHALHAKYEDTYEDHIAHALTRCAMIRWLENDKR